MKIFIRKILIFCLLMILGFAGFEYLARRISTDVYALKNKAIETKGDSIKTLFMGSSISYWGIDPHYWPDRDVYNLAFNGGKIDVEYFLLESVVDRLSNLKVVILEMPHFVMIDPPFGSEEVSERLWRAWIAPTVFFNTNEDGNFLRKDMLVLNPDTYRKDLMPWSTGREFTPDDFGHTDSRPAGRVYYDWKNMIEKSVEEMQSVDKTYLEYNTVYFYKILELCWMKGYDVIIYLPPVYYPRMIDGVYPEKILVYNVVNKYRKKFKYRVISYFDDRRFSSDDFVDGVHLTTDQGAAKLTKFLIEDVFNDSAPVIVHDKYGKSTPMELSANK